MTGAGFFLTGTGTGVGKTVAAAALVAVLRSEGIDAAPAKPVQTGAVRAAGEPAGRLASPDLELCLSLSGTVPREGERELMAPCLLEPECSPHLAASLEGREIVLPPVVEAVRRLGAGRACVVAEGAGGVLVPLGAGLFMLDLIVALGMPAIVAARPGLGTINHTLLTLRALRDAGAGVAGVVFCEAGPAERGAVERDNETVIASLGDCTVLGRVPHFPGLAAGGGAAIIPPAAEFAAACRDALPGYVRLAGELHRSGTSRRSGASRGGRP